MTNRIQKNSKPPFTLLPGPHAQPPQVNGAIALDAAILKDKVGGIFDACLGEKMPYAPEIREVMGVIQPNGGHLNVQAVKDRYEQTWWGIVRQLRSLGLDHTAGSFSMEFVGQGVTQEGHPAVQFALCWKLGKSLVST